jgi:hypothetical protein
MVKKINKWRNFKAWINAKPIGTIFTRTEMLAALENGQVRETSTDHFRLKITHIGYISRIKRGQFIINKHIEDELSWPKARERAKNWDHPLRSVIKSLIDNKNNETNLNEYIIELVWNREFHWVFYKTIKATLVDAKKIGKEILYMGDGARVKKLRLIDSNGKKYNI